MGSLRSIKAVLFLLLLAATFSGASAQDHELFSLGTKSNSGEGFSLYPDQYSAFIANDFGLKLISLTYFRGRKTAGEELAPPLAYGLIL